MERIEDRIDEDLIDLGAASVQTQGMFPLYPEIGIGTLTPPGLARD